MNILIIYKNLVNRYFWQEQKKCSFVNLDYKIKTLSELKQNSMILTYTHGTLIKLIDRMEIVNYKKPQKKNDFEKDHVFLNDKNVLNVRLLKNFRYTFRHFFS